MSHKKRVKSLVRVKEILLVPVQPIFLKQETDVPLGMLRPPRISRRCGESDRDWAPFRGPIAGSRLCPGMPVKEREAH